MRLERITGVLLVTMGIGMYGAAAEAPRSSPSPVHSAAPKPPTKAEELTPQHKTLEKFVGHWKSTIHVLPSEESPGVQDASGTVDGKLRMEGRFAELTQTSVMDGKPSEGIMLFGFDPVINKFTAIKADTSSPAFISYIGTYDAGKKQITMEARYSEQVTHKYVVAKLIVSFVDADSISMDEYVARGVGASPVPTKTVTYKRG